jgi:HlyD family secretion protein
VQLNPVVTNNVVTYNVVMEVDNEPRTTYVPGPDPRPGGAPQGPHPAGRPSAKPIGGFAAGQTGTLEYTTARYMPPGSPVYNGNLALFPGMTADCTIVTNRKENTLRVPSSALRFNPAAFVPAEELKAASGPQGEARSEGKGGAQPGQRPAAGGGNVLSRGLVARREDRLWTLQNGKLRAIPVRAGVSDGTFTEVSGDAVAEGLVVVTGVEEYKKVLAPAGGAPLAGGGMRH